MIEDAKIRAAFETARMSCDFTAGTSIQCGYCISCWRKAFLSIMGSEPKSDNDPRWDTFISQAHVVFRKNDSENMRVAH